MNTHVRVCTGMREQFVWQYVCDYEGNGLNTCRPSQHSTTPGYA